jgi:alpha-beta hydrolase superfamily lysophospholipase
MSAEAQTVVLIHGMWMTPRSWDAWVDHYRDRGYNAIAPGWPAVKDPEETRRDPSGLKGLGVKRISDHYDQIVRAVERPPIIMGHSFGGLITQLLLDRGLGAAGVAIGTAPPNGIRVLPVSTLRASFPALKNPFNRDGLAPLSRSQFQYRFTNTISRQESDAIYDEHYIPGTNRAFFDAVTSKSAAGVDWANSRRAPLLLIAGSEDHISPVPLNRKIHKLQSKASSPTELKEYTGRPHFMAGLDGWEELADVALNWALEHEKAVAEEVSSPERTSTT